MSICHAFFWLCSSSTFFSYFNIFVCIITMSNNLKCYKNIHKHYMILREIFSEYFFFYITVLGLASRKTPANFIGSYISEKRSKKNQSHRLHWVIDWLRNGVFKNENKAKRKKATASTATKCFWSNTNTKRERKKKLEFHIRARARSHKRSSVIQIKKPNERMNEIYI